MLNKISVSPLNSLLFISDRDGAQPPEPIRGEMIWSTPACIAFGCFPEQDGLTEITIGPSKEVEPQPLLVFDGNLETPNRVVAIFGVEMERVLSVDVARQKTNVRIWYSHPKWPEKITIGLE